MPWIGLGVFRIEDNNEAQRVVETALKVGYRHIDTAMYYHNEEAVGKAIKNSGIPRKKFSSPLKCGMPTNGVEK